MAKQSMKRIVWWYFVVSLFSVIAALLTITFDMLCYKSTGSFRLFKMLNTVPMETVQESWFYLGDIGFEQWAELIVPPILKIGLVNVLLCAAARILKLLRSKTVIAGIAISGAIIIAYVCLYYRFISGSVSEYYIRRFLFHLW